MKKIQILLPIHIHTLFVFLEMGLLQLGTYFQLFSAPRSGKGGPFLVGLRRSAAAGAGGSTFLGKKTVILSFFFFFISLPSSLPQIKVVSLPSNGFPSGCGFFSATPFGQT